MERPGLRRLYPLVFAIIPVVHVVASNPGQSRLATLVVLVAALCGGFGLLYLLLHRVQRGTRWAGLASLIVLAAVAWFYFAPLVQHFVETFTGARPRPVVTLPLGLAGTVAVLARFAKRSRIRDGVEAMLATAGALLLGFSVARLGINELRAHRTLARSGIVADLAVPVRASRTIDSTAAPDIYLIVLDGYTNAAILHELFGTTNPEFEDSLKALGFTIPKLTRSNYVQTEFSLPSLLNFAYLDRVPAEVGRSSTDRSLLNYLVENNRLVGFLKARGYRFVFFPSEWWRGTDHSRHADREFEVASGLSVRRALAGSELQKILWEHTVLGTLGSLHPVEAEHIEQTFAGLRSLEPAGHRTFVFAHLLFPHPPFVLNERCEPEVGSYQGNPDRRYLDQVRCANAFILELVTTLVGRPGPRPIIVLQGDHGSSMRGFNQAPSPAEVTPGQARERFGAFGAYYLPDGGERLFADTVTIVNVFRKILSYYFGAELAPEPDRFYMSVRKPYELVEVDPMSLR